MCQVAFVEAERGGRIGTNGAHRPVIQVAAFRAMARRRARNPSPTRTAVLTGARVDGSGVTFRATLLAGELEIGLAFKKLRDAELPLDRANDSRLIALRSARVAEARQAVVAAVLVFARVGGE